MTAIALLVVFPANKTTYPPLPVHINMRINGQVIYVFNVKVRSGKLVVSRFNMSSVLLLTAEHSVMVDVQKQKLTNFTDKKKSYVHFLCFNVIGTCAHKQPNDPIVGALTRLTWQHLPSIPFLLGPDFCGMSLLGGNRWMPALLTDDDDE